MPPMTLEELTDELTSQKETIQHLLSSLEKERNDRELRHAEATPVGTIAAFGGGTFENVPPGWLPCDGRAVRQEPNLANADEKHYPLLFKAIGFSWSSTVTPDFPPGFFRLPDLRGFFLRGLDGGRKVDPDAARRVNSRVPGERVGDVVGSSQPDAFRSHNHPATSSSSSSVSPNPHAHGYREPDGGGSSGARGNQGLAGRVTSETSLSVSTSTTTTIGETGGGETRPKNVSVLWIIKADPETIKADPE
jgi:hypothetical protein